MVAANLVIEEFAESPTIAAPNSPGKFIKVESQPISAKRPSGPAWPIVENIATNEAASTAKAIKKEITTVARS